MNLLNRVFLGALALSAALALATAQDSEVIFPVRGPDGNVKFSVHADGTADLASQMRSPRFSASESLDSPLITATTQLVVGEVDVAATLEENQAERAVMAQQLEKLEAEGAASAIAEQEQNVRVEKLEADAAANAAADVELTERVAKAEEDIAGLKATDEEVQASLQAAEAKFEQQLQELETSHAAQLKDLQDSMETKHKEQQQIIDLLVEIVAKFDVSGQLQQVLETRGGEHEGQN